jgi:hypothetical protein
MTNRLNVKIDAKDLGGAKAVRELLRHANRHPKLVKEFLQVIKGLGGLTQLVRIDSTNRVAGRTTYLRVTFEASDLLSKFLATLRAVPRQRNVI